MTTALRAGVVGCGFFAQNHLNAWAGLDGVELAAVCDRERAKAERARSTFGVPAAYDDAAAMLAAERLDFVDLATTVESHRALVELCAAHRLPVICQKPFGRDLAECRAMVEACAQAGVPLMVHENFRWQAPLLAVRRALDDGLVGRPFFARISFRHGYDIYATQPYLLTEERHAIYDLGVHLLDLARFFLGEVEQVYCRADRIDPRVRGEDAVVLLQTLVRIEGERGTVELEPGYRLVLSRPGQREERDVEPPVPAWGARPWHVIQDSVISLQRHWLACLRAGREPATSGRDYLATFALVEAAYAAAASGLPVAPAA